MHESDGKCTRSQDRGERGIAHSIPSPFNLADEKNANTVRTDINYAPS